MAIVEFSSSNGFSSFTLNFECRTIIIREIEDKNHIHFSYLVRLPSDLSSDTSCQERGYENLGYKKIGLKNYSSCKTSFQGKKCSMMKLLSILISIG